jgi:hypothetical protein
VIQFPEFFLQVVIIVALVFSGVAALSLILMLIKDKKNSEVW